MLMLAASSGKVKITKPGAKKQYVFLGVNFPQINVGKGIRHLLVKETSFSGILPIVVLVTTEETFSIPTPTHSYIRQSYGQTALSSYNIPSPWKSRRKPVCTAGVNPTAPLQAFPGLPASPPCSYSSRVLPHSAWVCKGRAM